MADPIDSEGAESEEEHLRLFLSADLQGSTRIKQLGTGKAGATWLPTVLDFVKRFPERVAACRSAWFRSESAQEGIHEPSEMTVWKVLGDEVVFECRIRNRHDLISAVSAFHNALESANKATVDARRREQSSPRRLFVKGTAWVAGFPVANSVVKLNDRYDYIGPSMDLGFRLTKLAGAGRFVVTADLAWLLCKFEFATRLFFSGRQPLAGIAENGGYPVCWIKVTHSPYEEAEHQILAHKELGCLEGCKLLESFILEHGVPRHTPFLEGETELTPRPDWYDRLRKQIRERGQKEMTDEHDESPTGGGLSAAETDQLLKQIRELAAKIRPKRPG